jgi:hypothetical protein
MAQIILPTPKEGATDKQTVQNLYDAVYRMRKELEFALLHLDAQNVKAVSADWIYAGTVTTDQLIAGTAKITTAMIETLEVGENVQIGTAQDEAGVTSIIGGTVTTSFVNALSVVAGSVAAENITGTTITGKTLRSNPPGNDRLEISNGVWFKDSNDDIISSINRSGNYLYVDGGNGGDTMGLILTADRDVNITASDGYIILNANGGSYIGSVSASNEILTKGDGDSYYADIDHDHDGEYIKVGTGGSKTISYINATSTGIVIWFTDGTNKTITYD